MSLVVTGLSYGTFLLDIILLTALVAYLVSRAGLYDFSQLAWYDKLEEFLGDYSVHLTVLTALVATSGSLYLSNVLGWEPCRLCWFQRILMYPIVLIGATGLALQKDDVADYILPLAMVGIPVSAYHYLVQRFVQFQSAGCSIFSVSCSTKYTFYLGYITIPMMALTAFIAITVLMWKFQKKQ